MDWETFDYRILIDYERFKQFVFYNKISAPRFAILYITNVCNQKCSYCEYAKENTGNYMPKKRVLTCIDELKDLGVGAIEFCGGGEPLLHPDIDEIIQYCGKKGLAVGIFSNFSFKNGRLLRTIVEKCSYLRVSLDTFDKAEYAFVRGVDSLDQVKSNLKTLVRLKKEHHSPINIGVKMLLTEHNWQTIEEFVSQAEELGVDNVQFKKVYLCPELEIDDRLIKPIEDSLCRLKADYKGKIDIFYGFCNLELKVDCFTNINHVFIDAYGDVYLCCHYLDRKPEHKLGSITQDSLKNIWFSGKHLQVIRGIDKDVCNRTDCRWIKYNNFMHPLIKDKGKSLDFI